jgi:hypothetical protein
MPKKLTPPPTESPLPHRAKHEGTLACWPSVRLASSYSFDSGADCREARPTTLRQEGSRASSRLRGALALVACRTVAKILMMRALQPVAICLSLAATDATTQNRKPDGGERSFFT